MKKLIIILLLYFTASSGFAQVVFEHLTKNQGLPNNNITCIAQDKYGFMWFGSYNGLIRYDGNDFRYFNIDQKFPYKIRNNQIRDLYIHPTGAIFIAFNYQGFAIYDPDNASFKYFRHNQRDPDKSLVNDKIYSLSASTDGKVWICTNAGLDLFDPEKESIEHFRIRDAHGNAVPTIGVASVFDNGDGELWLYTVSNQIIRYSKATDKFTYFPLPSPTNASLLNRGGVVFKDSRGHLWIGTEYSGLYKLYPETGQLISYRHTSQNRPYKVVMEIIEDEEKTIWIATDGDGIIRYSPEKDVCEQFVHDPSNSNSINTNAVYCLYSSKPGIIWAGMYSGGVNIYKKKKRKFFSFTDTGAPGSRLTHKSVLSFAESPDGKVLIGTDGGGLNIFDPLNKTFTSKTSETGYCFNIVKSLLKDSRGRIWSGSYGNGACMTDSQGRQRHISAAERNHERYLNHSSVWAIQEATDGKIWMGLLQNGIDIFDPDSETFEHLTPEAFGRRLGNVYSIICDSKNRMWMATEEGCLILYKPENHTFISYNSQNTSGISSDFANVVMQDKQGNIWVGLENGGISKLTDIENKSATNYSIKDGLPGASVNAIEEDNKGLLWLGTDNGLARLNPLTREIKSFGLEHGLQGMEFKKGASFKDKMGYLYFGSGEGFICFHPDSIWYNELEPKSYVTAIRINNQEITTEDENQYISRNIPFAEQLTLTHKDYIISFQFSALDYLIPEKNKYAYMLEGFDKEWVYAGADRPYATYTSLPPGTYNFLIKAANSDGLWNKIPATIMVKVLPPWWNTTWFKGLAGFVISGLIAGTMYFRIRMEKSQRLLLEKLVQERTIQLNQSNATKDKLFSIIAHDLKGPVNSMKGLSSMIEAHYEKMQGKDMKEAIGHISKASGSLSELVNNLFAWARLHTKNLQPEKQLINVSPVIERIVEVYTVQAMNKGITICYKRSAIDAQVYADQNMYETIIRNLINNAVKFTDEGGIITVTCEQEKGFTSTIVKDTGVGMEQEKVDQLFDSSQSTSGTQGESGTGLGLTICHDFVKANDGTISVRSKIGEGTEFEVRFRSASE